MPWTTQPITVDIDPIDVLEQIPEEAIIEYMQSLGYQVTK